MAKDKAPDNELEKLRADRAVLIAAVQATEAYGRYHDHGIRMKAIAALKAVGEWPDQ